MDSITDYADNKNKERTVYFIPKIKRLQDIQYLKEAAEDHSAIAVLDRQDFTPLTQKLLYQEFHECLDFKKSRYTFGMKKYIDSQNRR